jgi:plastocyanin
MRRFCLAALLALIAASCGSGSDSDRTVFVDHSHDEFASFVIANFPEEVAVPAGGAVVFKQIWTGEPHTVTGGTLVDEMMSKAEHWIDLFSTIEPLSTTVEGFPDPENEPEASVADAFAMVERSRDPRAKKFFAAYDALVDGGSELPARDALGDTTVGEIGEIIDRESEEVLSSSGLPWALDESDKGAFVTQNAGQPCFLDTGGPPKDADTACRDSEQSQPAFNGKHSYYNSGIIPYEGPRGNTFRVDIAADAKPGTYFFYCAVHGPDQHTKVDVRPRGSKVPSQAEVSERAQAEIAEVSKPMLALYNDAKDGEIELGGDTIEGPFAGLSPEVHGSINAFLPENLKTRVGEPVTWKVMGSDHTISFDVPEYFPIITFANDGKVALNKRLQKPAGGSAAIPEQEGEGIVEVDGGTYDGDGFFSSGLFGGQPYATYTLRFSKPGTYRYACLLHPPMVGTVDVT